MPEQPAAADQPPSRSTARSGDRSFQPTETIRLADQVVAWIQDLIHEEGLAPGDRLPAERDLAERLGASRAIVSQALRTLSLMGLVEVRRGSGAYVTRNPEAIMVASFDLLLRSQDDSVDALAELRYWLETLGAQHALRAADAGVIEDLERAFERLEASAGHTSEWIATDTMFHAALVRAAANPFLGPLYESAHTAVVSVVYKRWVEADVTPTWLRGKQRAAQLDLHRPIVEAVHSRDEEALAVALARHHQAILDHLAHRDEGPPGSA
jgi:GntR family transcriptional regulator, transcriptional repressor for pyruvate dehydrogenase complex